MPYGCGALDVLGVSADETGLLVLVVLRHDGLCVSRFVLFC